MKLVRCSFFNPSFLRALNYEDDELLTQSFFKILHPDSQEFVERIFKTAGKFPIRNFEAQCCCKDGSYRLIRWSAQSKHDRFYIVGTDITEQRKFEKQLKRIKEKSYEFSIKEATAYALKQTEFISQLSHEIRNPLNGLYGLIEVTKDQLKLLQNYSNESSVVIDPSLKNKIDELYAGLEDNMTNIVLCLNHQQTILNDNIDLSMISERNFFLQNTSLNLNKLIKLTISMLDVTAKQKGLELISQLPEDEMFIKGDSTRIKQIIINLIANSIKFTHQGKVEVINTLRKN